MKGIWKKIIEVDLTAGNAVAKELPESFYLKYLGGLGLASRLLLDYTEKGIDPLSEKNVLVIAPGLLVGTGLPTASKTTLTFKSPETNAFGRSVSGAFLGAALKKAGFDAMVIKGKSNKPVYLVIDDEKFTIKDASGLWGKDTLETQEILQKELGNDFRTAAIGPAGEKLLRIA
ncbi:MAG: aldehyde:ferredoxin oxidoreductase, partial [Caldisericaceae bacterium]|nr:aldehyde:ferredoxin oxidoreductase [Caldisericaceae bacterium]